MKLRSNHIILIIAALLAVFFVYVLFGARTTPDADVSDEAFIESINEQIASGNVAGEEVGLLPPSGVELKHAPRMEVTTRHLDVGTVSPESPYTTQLMVRNTGDALLEIHDYKTTCPCTTPFMKRTRIPAGESEPVEIIIFPSQINGWHSTKRITIYSNDPKSPVIEIDVEVRFEPEFYVDNRDVRLGKIEKGEGAEARIHFTQANADEFAITGIERTDVPGYVDISFRKLPPEEWADPDLAEYEVLVRISEDAPAGMVSAQFNVLTNIARLTQLACVVRGNVDTFYTVDRDVVAISKRHVAEGKSRPVTIRGDRPFTVMDVKSETEDFQAEVREGEEPNSVVIDISVSPRAQPGKKEGKLEFVIVEDGTQYKESVELHAAVPERDAEQ